MLTWFRKNMKGIMIAVAVLFVASMFYGLGYRGLRGGAGKDKALAKVNGVEVDRFRYQEILNRVARSFGNNLNPQTLAYAQNMALGQAIDFTLMLGEAKKKVRVPGREIDAAVEGIMQQQKIPSKRDLERALKPMGMDLGKFRELIKQEIMVQKLSLKLAEEVKITPDDLKEVRASNILVTTEATAKEIVKKLNGGADFAALAKSYSQDPGSAAKGGDLGYFTTGTMVPAFENVAFSLKPGQTSGIIKTQFGYHLIKVTAARLRKITGDPKAAEKTALKEKQEKHFRQWYQEIRTKAKVEILSHELKAIQYRMMGQAQPAIEEYKKAIAADPANPYLEIALGDIYVATGQKGAAIAEYENAVRKSGGNPELYLILGKAYENMGEKGLANQQYERASLIAGDSKETHERLLKIFQELKNSTMIAKEKSELARLAKKAQFEKELQQSKP